MNTPSSLQIDIKRTVGELPLNVRFSTHSGLTAVFGRSGSGKTSLLNMLAGLDRPDEGKITVSGRVLFDSAAGVDVAVEHRRIGYVFQDSRLFPHLSVRRNLRYGRRLGGPGQADFDFGQVVDLLDLGGLLDRNPSVLSGGEKQRVAIGRALLAQPKILLMDEPLASLDAGRRSEILSFIEKVRDQLDISIIYVSHAMDEVIRLADAMVLLDNGKAVASGRVEEITGRLDLHPLTGRYEAGAVISATVAGHDEEFKLSKLHFSDRELWVPRLDLEPGKPLRVRVRARDVSLSLARPEGSSFLNIFEARVKEISQSDGPQVDLLIDAGVPMIARITRKSLSEMKLEVGGKVFAMVKAAAMDRHGMGLAGTRRRKSGARPSD